MLRKYTLIASVLVVFGMPFKANAQTLDITMKIQAILDQFSEIRSGLKQIQSSMNIETMLQNLGGGGDWKEMLKNAAGGIFDKNAEKGGTKQALLILPDGLADKAEEADKAINWMKDNMFIRPSEKGTEAAQKKNDMMKQMRYTAYVSAYGKAVATRKQLDKDLETIEKLKQDAQSKDAETDLQNEINKVALLKLEQANYQQLLASSRSQMEGAAELISTNKLMAAKANN